MAGAERKQRRARLRRRAAEAKLRLGPGRGRRGGRSEGAPHSRTPDFISKARRGISSSIFLPHLLRNCLLLQHQPPRLATKSAKQPHTAAAAAIPFAYRLRGSRLSSPSRRFHSHILLAPHSASDSRQFQLRQLAAATALFSPNSALYPSIFESNSNQSVAVKSVSLTFC